MRLKAIFVQNLRAYRRARGISQMALAEMCGTSTSYIGQIEIGNRFPSPELIEKIAKALQIKAYLLFRDESDTDTVKKPPSLKTCAIPDSVKRELIKELTVAVHRVVKRIK